MVTAPRPARRSLFLIILAGTLGCSSSELLLPEPPGGGENVALSKSEGDNQHGTVGEQLPEPVVVSVRTARDLPASGRQVEFITIAGDVEIARDTAVTDSEGKARLHCMLGTAPGDYRIQARLIVVEGEPQIREFTARAEPGPPDSLSAMSPVSQPGRRGRNAATPPVVRVVDRFGNAVPGVVVAWQVTAGQGQVSEPLTRTAPDGTAVVEWSLGNRMGVHKLTATIEQATVPAVTFTATVLF